VFLGRHNPVKRRKIMKRLCWLSILVTLFVFCFLGPVLGQSPKPPQKTKGLVNTGNTLFEQNCVACHGSKGDGKGMAASTLTPPPSDFALPLKKWPNTKGDPQKIFEVITKGISNSAMVGWAQFSEKEKWGLVYYVIGFSKGT
jgi:mono/diheme cytochrome c family protein